MKPSFEAIREPDRPELCPRCGSPEVLTIVYGLIQDPTPFAGQRVDFGGCCVTPDDPAWRCDDCSHGWGWARL